MSVPAELDLLMIGRVDNRSDTAGMDADLITPPPPAPPLLLMPAGTLSLIGPRVAGVPHGHAHTHKVQLVLFLWFLVRKRSRGGFKWRLLSPQTRLEFELFIPYVSVLAC